MAEFGYRNWGLIPVDAEPRTSGAGPTRPPMLTPVAVDRGGSLVFELGPHEGRVALRLETTALAAEGREPECFEVYSGSAERYTRLSGVQWKKTMEGLSGVFCCLLSGVGSHLKLRSRADDNLVVTAVHFTAP